MKIIHTMIRVTNLEKSIEFYQKILGMKLLKLTDYPEGKFTLAFLGFEENGAQIELTYNYDVKSYELGNAFGHVALEVHDIYNVCENIKKLGGNVCREPGPMKHGTTHIAFVEDPDGYKIELIGR